MRTPATLPSHDKSRHRSLCIPQYRTITMRLFLLGTATDVLPIAKGFIYPLRYPLSILSASTSENLWVHPPKEELLTCCRALILLSFTSSSSSSPLLYAFTSYLLPLALCHFCAYMTIFPACLTSMYEYSTFFKKSENSFSQEPGFLN